MSRKTIVLLGLALAITGAVLGIGVAILFPDHHDAGTSDHSTGAMAAIVACSAAVVAASNRRRRKKCGEEKQDG